MWVLDSSSHPETVSLTATDAESSHSATCVKFVSALPIRVRGAPSDEPGYMMYTVQKIHARLSASPHDPGPPRLLVCSRHGCFGICTLLNEPTTDQPSPQTGIATSCNEGMGASARGCSIPFDRTCAHIYGFYSRCSVSLHHFTTDCTTHFSAKTQIRR